MIQKQVVEHLKELFKDPYVKKHFELINDPNRYVQAKLQEQFLIENSNGFFISNSLNDYKSPTFDAELDLKFGDFMDIYGNYYDLKTGETYAGSINLSSVNAFGDTKSNRHWYICTNRTLNKLYIINARTLHVNQNSLCWQRSSKNNLYIGEKQYQKMFKSVL